MAGMAETFAEALQRAESTRDPEPLVDLFAPDAELKNLAVTERGTDGAREFWQTYLDQFSDVRSEFSQVIEGDGQAALVWTSTGTLKGGAAVTYRGVSLLAFEGDRVRRFESIYDSAPFLRPATAT